MPSVISTLRQNIHIICMLKDHPKWLYEYNGKKLRLKDLYLGYGTTILTYRDCAISEFAIISFFFLSFSLHQERIYVRN